MVSSAEIRRQFIAYFEQKHQHRFVPSSPVVPLDDPTLLFTNAGMNQFKDVFLATGRRDYTRAANTQKCIRAGGKHNDLEDVGKDTYHHTFFEMLGNWSFGDYFKKESIDWAWDLLVNVWGLDPTRLHATYFEGDPAEGLEPDEEARQLWLQYLPPERVHPGNKKDNFWEMGDTGPCGPCTEIHIDRTPDKSGGHLVNGGDARVMEIWNLVFIQFNRNASGTLSPLPARHVDTGMGFERICAVIASKDKGYDPNIGNYDTDVFAPIFAATAKLTGARPYTAVLEDRLDTGYRIIADHIRTLTFALTDGAAPGNEGRNYVLRRILRRASRQGWQVFNMKEPFLYKLVDAVVAAMGDAFPELKKNPQRVADLIREEEESFGRTLERGIALFEQAAQKGQGSIPAEDAFKLHDTYGFPLDLTQVMAEERGLKVDVKGFHQLMEDARNLSRAGATAHGADVLVEIVQKNNPSATTFKGYETASWTGEVEARFYNTQAEHADKPVTLARAGDALALTTSITPFYAESGGQVGDKGQITSASGAVFVVENTVKVGEVFFHLGHVEKGEFASGNQTLTFEVNRVRRNLISANHTTTHVMNRALRAKVNPQADQKGSLVDDQKLRFDFSHGAALTPEQIQEVETMVNADIAADLPVYFDFVPQEQALKINGLRAVFGEKYPPVVRVVSIGRPVAELVANPSDSRWANLSIEFCGGVHLPKTGDAEGFVIVSEEAVAKGVRRITALTGAAAHKAAAQAQLLLTRLEGLKSADPAQLASAIAEVSAELNASTLPAISRAKIRDGIAELQKIVKDYERQKSKANAGAAVDLAREVADNALGNLIVHAFEDMDGNALRDAMDVIRKKKPEASLLLGAVSGDKIAFIAAVPQDAIQKGLKAGDWVREVAKVAGGGGGGRPDMAQAGGKDATKLHEALEVGKAYATSKLG